MFEVAIDCEASDFLTYLMKEHKVLSCIARTGRNVNHSVVVNN